LSNERRAQDRLPIRLRVEYECLEDFLTDYTANVSIGGMFIETARPLPLGTKFRLRFHLPGFSEPVDTEAEVRWVLEEADPGPLPSGMGVRFQGMTPQLQVKISALLEGWENS
jgi:type IV pilus assembly protein PilZ